MQLGFPQFCPQGSKSTLIEQSLLWKCLPHWQLTAFLETWKCYWTIPKVCRESVELAVKITRTIAHIQLHSFTNLTTFIVRLLSISWVIQVESLWLKLNLDMSLHYRSCWGLKAPLKNSYDKSSSWSITQLTWSCYLWLSRLVSCIFPFVLNFLVDCAILFSDTLFILLVVNCICSINPRMSTCLYYWPFIKNIHV